MQNSMNNVRKLTMTAILSAISTVLMFFSINVPLMPSFIKLDFSELPALIAAFTMGPVSGIVVCFIKNLMNLLTTTTGGIGELSNFILGCFFVLPAGIFYNRKKTKTVAIVTAVLGTVLMSLASVVSNFFVIYPIYFNILPLEAILNMYHLINPIIKTEPTNENLLQALLMFNLPFTMIKGMLSVIVTILIYKPLSPIIHGKNV